MGFADRLKTARLAAGLSQKQLGKLLGVTGNAVSNYENGISSPNENVLLSIFDILNVEPNFLFQDCFSKNTSNSYLAKDEINLISNYRSVSSSDRQLLQSIASRLTSSRYVSSNNVRSLGGHYPNFGLASAGNGALAQDDPIDWEYGQPPKGATCTITIKGDSMEPKLHDGQTIWVDTTKMVESGEIGVFVINGEAFCKKFVRDENGPRLVSLNKAYEPITFSEYDEVRVFGRVIFE